jgi:hypothetical protein
MTENIRQVLYMFGIKKMDVKLLRLCERKEGLRLKVPLKMT